MSNIVPWQLPEEDAPLICQCISEGDRKIEIPIYGSITPDESRWLEFHNAKHGVKNAGINAIADAVYGFLLLRFGLAVFASDKLVPLKGKLPTFEETVCEGTPPRLLPSTLLLKVYYFFLDEFNECLGKPREALRALEEAEAKARAAAEKAKAEAEAESLKDGSLSTGESSDTTPTTPDSQDSPSEDAQSISSVKHFKPKKLSA